MNKSIVDLLHFCDQSCHILMLLPRQKDGFATGEKWTRARHYFVSNKGQWLSKVDYLKKLVDEGEQGRIYTTYNARSLAHGARNLGYLIADSIPGGNYQWLMRGKGIIASCLKKKGTRYSKDYYMVDIDTKDVETISLCESIARGGDTRGESCFVDLFETPNGYHMLIKPMDVRMFNIENVEVKNDEFLFVGK